MRLKVLSIALAAGLATFGMSSIAFASGTPTVIPLSLPQSNAFSVLKHSCGGIQEQSIASTFDSTSGYPAGFVYLRTSCSSGGRGSRPSIYTAWTQATWDFTGVVVSFAALTAAPTVDPNATATDANSNEVYTNVTATTVSPSTCTPSNTAQCTFHGFLSRAAGYIPVPRLTHLSSAIGRASGGQSISISGTGFTGATTVTFGGSPAAGFTVNSDNSITATTPTMAPGSYDVTVTTLGGSNPAGPLDRFLFVALPSVVKISPQAGLVTGFTPVTITGVNLSLVSQVLFGGVPTGFTVNSDKSITATAPPTDGEAIIQVTVVSPGGTSASISATRFIYAPTTCSSSSPCESSVHCSKLTGAINGSMTASSCSPKSSLNSSATFTLAGSLKWSPGGRTTLAYIATPSSMGRGACAVGHVEESLAGAVVGGTSSYTSFGDSVYGLVCVSKSTHKVALLSGSKLLL